jgi:hypothetical protein
MISAYRTGKSYIQNLSLTLAIIIVLCFGLIQIDWIDIHAIILALVSTLIAHSLASFRSVSTETSSRDSGSTNQQSKTSVEKQTLYVGNLLYRTRKEDLIELFSPFGTVHSARIILDRDTRKSKGYGFVELDAKAAQRALSELNNSQFQGRALKITEAKGRDS